jgi:diguanylate cyclase (GGDEF)-like protein
MKRISIRLFILSIFLSVFIIQIFIFYGFFKSAEQNMVTLLRENLQAKVLMLKHFLEKNIQINNINNIVTFIDNTVVTSDIIEDIHIVNNNQKLVYSTDRSSHTIHEQIKCLNMTEITHANLYENGCFTFSIRLFNGLTPYYYKVYLYTNTHYINSLLSHQKYKYASYFFGFTLLFFLFFWYIVSIYLTKPLEKLRQFAYYSTKEPKAFRISELESIRYSLVSTFSRLKQEQEELYKLSTKDSLCGLYNRLSLMEKLKWVIGKAQRDKSEFALIFIDLDNFKNINDSKGHDFGDEILQEVAALLFEAIRENDFVARFGGDEFVIILPDFKDETSIINIAQRIQKQFQTLTDHALITASMGIAIYPKDGKDASTLLKNADIAMYKAKELGKSKYHFFTESLNKIIEEHLFIQKLLRKALREKHFRLYYQPKVDITTNKVVGCEALLRLIDPAAEGIRTDTLITVAEQSGLIKEIGQWVIEEASEQLKRWKGTLLEEIKVSINVSTVQFHDKIFLEHLASTVMFYDIHSKLDIELTESLLISDIKTTVTHIENIKALGITLSLDDFGTGYSSLSYLKQIPFDTLKIDRSFVKDMQSKQNHSFVEMIINISKILNLEVVAEGVETKEQLHQLQTMGCDFYQGYLCSPPLPVEAFEALFHRYNT